jgi:RNA polymerase sigma factor (sigma-70 family)
MLDIETLYRECSDDLYRALRRRFDCSVSDALIEDACQAAWTIAWRCRARVSGEFMAWLVVVARHELLALLRKQSGEFWLGDDVLERLDCDSDPQVACEARLILETLAGLTANQRVALGLVVAGYSYDEVAALTGKTYTWVNRHVSEGRARARLLAAG